jgi:C_GCAxxG_C_C family probable redox protein
MAGMGGGIAEWGEVCGAAIGAVAALGLPLGTHHPSQQRNPLLRTLAGRYLQDFQREWGSVLCSAVRPRAEARTGDGDTAKVCTVVVRYAAEEAARLLMEIPSRECEAEST